MSSTGTMVEEASLLPPEAQDAMVDQVVCDFHRGKGFSGSHAPLTERLKGHLAVRRAYLPDPRGGGRPGLPLDVVRVVTAEGATRTRASLLTGEQQPLTVAQLVEELQLAPPRVNG